MTIHDLLQLTIDTNASDLHLIAGVPPMMRVNSVLAPIQNEPILTPEVVQGLVNDIMLPAQIQRVEAEKELDFSVAFSEKARFRANVYTQKGSRAAAFRRIPVEIPPLDTLRLPPIIQSLTKTSQGLILVTGPTGQGKSTTIASMIDRINEERAEHVVTVEDPIEFIFRPKKSIFSQREMSSDTLSWEIALRSVLREDPDIVYIGEMRDLETISSALTVAETGHLVFATLHTNSAAQTVDRIVDVFPENQQIQIRMQLANVLEAVFSQRLVMTHDRTLVPAHEVMLGTAAIRNAIREGKTHQIDSIIQTSTELGMNTLDTALANLVQQGVIELETAHQHSLRPAELNRLVRGTSK